MNIGTPKISPGLDGLGLTDKGGCPEREVRAVISFGIASPALAPLLYFMYLCRLPRKGSTAMHDMVIAGSILLFLGLASGYMASPTLRRSLVWLPGLLTVDLTGA
ncbi:MAG: hypothetical protein HPY55_13845 [Firmicutes bacterium]|nr:hypothetical protein [Bacillota bacterium]